MKAVRLTLVPKHLRGHLPAVPHQRGKAPPKIMEAAMAVHKPQYLRSGGRNTFAEGFWLTCRNRVGARSRLRFGLCMPPPSAETSSARSLPSANRRCLLPTPASGAADFSCNIIAPLTAPSTCGSVLSSRLPLRVGGRLTGFGCGRGRGVGCGFACGCSLRYVGEWTKVGFACGF